MMLCNKASMYKNIGIKVSHSIQLLEMSVPFPVVNAGGSGAPQGQPPFVSLLFSVEFKKQLILFPI